MSKIFEIEVYGSGSSGNCILVNTGDCKFLLDAGISIKDTKEGLRKSGLRLSDIDYILVTHSHIDHVKGLKNIVEKYNTTVIISNGELLTVDIPNAMARRIKHRQTIEICNTKVTAYNSKHDTNEALFFSVENSIGEKLLYLTDCGTSEGIDVEEHDCYVIEANYYMDGILSSLQSSQIHVVQFNRTSSDTGHLEIRDTIDILRRSIKDKKPKIILSHLSSANGNGDLFKSMVEKEFGLDDVDIAKKGLHIKFGEDINIF